MSARRQFKLLRALIPAVLLGGCAIGPGYKRPEAGAPAAFRSDNEAGATNSFADLPWWKVFQDDALQGIIRTALTNNYDLRIATTRVEQAQALAAEARSQFFPLIGYEGGVARGKNAASGSPSFNNGVTGNTFLLAGAATWEVDLWGRIRRLNESARAQYFATQEARRDVTISVISQTAQAYFQLLALDEELAIARRATNSYGDSLKLFSDRLNGGVASRLETSSAEALEAAAAATIPEFERQVTAQENLISVLLGQNPGPVARTGGVPLENLLPPDVPAGLPSTLLERRPDVREAEQLLRSANAQVGVAEASFLPQINLTALFGQVSPALSTFTAGGANVWNLAASMTGPLFQGGQLTAQYRQVKAAWEQARLQYQATVLNALQEVSDSLMARQKFAEEQVQQSRAVTAYEEATKVAMQRYQQGQANYFEVLQEQQLLFPAENTLVQAKLNQLTAVIQLYRALGGGWTQEPQ